MFFTNFSNTQYNGITITDISVSYDIINKYKNKIELFNIYTVQDGEKLEHIAHQLLGDQELHWIIAMMNDIVDPFYDYPLLSDEVNALAVAKYADIHATHHYVYRNDIYGYDPNNTTTFGNPSIANAVVVSNIEYEQNLNDEKRKLKIPISVAVQQIIKDFRALPNN